MMTTDDVILHGDEAERLRHNETLALAFKRHEEFLINGWVNTAADAAKERETLWLSIKALQAVQTHLLAMENEGKISKQTLEQKLREAATKAMQPVRKLWDKRQRWA